MDGNFSKSMIVLQYERKINITLDENCTITSSQNMLGLGSNMSVFVDL